MNKLKRFFFSMFFLASSSVFLVACKPDGPGENGIFSFIGSYWPSMLLVFVGFVTWEPIIKSKDDFPSLGGAFLAVLFVMFFQFFPSVFWYLAKNLWFYAIAVPTFFALGTVWMVWRWRRFSKQGRREYEEGVRKNDLDSIQLKNLRESYKLENNKARCAGWLLLWLGDIFIYFFEDLVRDIVLEIMDKMSGFMKRIEMGTWSDVDNEGAETDSSGDDNKESDKPKEEKGVEKESKADDSK